jgi:hypothetical protein
MTEHEQILHIAEEASRVVQDPELRKIAFQEIVRNELEKIAGAKTSSSQNRAKPVKSIRAPRVGKITRAAGVRDEIKAMDISPDEKDLPAWSSVSQDWKTFCWLLEAARTKGVDGLTSPELSYLADRIFRENFSPAQVNNLKKKIKSGYVRVVKLALGDRAVDAWKILSGGIEELKNHLRLPRNEGQG